MIDILSEQGVADLARFARADTLLGLDYDGTLAPIRPDPDAARLPAPTRELLATAARLYPTVIITGRSRDDMARLLCGVSKVQIIGSHGVERPGAESDAQAYAQQVERWFKALQARLEGQPGITIEHKRLSLSIHYRAAQSWTVARSVVLDAVTGLEGARITGGKAVVNVVPRSAPNKGEALMEACARNEAGFAIFVGDDVTDEDVFALDRPDTLLTVRVGYRRNSRAAYFLRRRGELNEMLRILIRHRLVSDPTSPITRVKCGLH